MFFQHREFWLPKDADRSAEYQDAFGVSAAKGIAAVADGVGSSLFSGSWARILTESVIAEHPEVDDEEMLLVWLESQRQKWLAPIDVNSLPWHQKPKFQKGAHSTLMWVELYHDPADNAVDEYDLYCNAIGDCCLFHVRGDKLLWSYPISDYKEFDNSPGVLGSTTGRSETPKFSCSRKTCLNGDLLLLCTDAIAQWALEYLDGGQPINWNAYWEMQEDAWREHIIQLREAQQIRYDDTTMLVLKVGPEPKPESSLEDLE